jgi:hypothetical protein
MPESWIGVTGSSASLVSTFSVPLNCRLIGLSAGVCWVNRTVTSVDAPGGSARGSPGGVTSWNGPSTPRPVTVSDSVVDVLRMRRVDWSWTTFGRTGSSVWTRFMTRRSGNGSLSRFSTVISPPPVPLPVCGRTLRTIATRSWWSPAPANSSNAMT